jgi:hypothetical protein
MWPWDNTPSQLWYYSHSGLNIASELELPEWSQCEQVARQSQPDVLIRVEPAAEIEFVAKPTTVITSSGEYTLRIPQVGYFQVFNNREICVRPLPAALPAKVRPWLLGRVWGALCYQRGLFIIHASAVQIGGEAILFCGRAARGKSTLAAQLNSRGYPLISDDLCRLDLPAFGEPVVYPAPPRVKLWNDSLDELGWREREMAPDPSRDGKFHLSVTDSRPAFGLTEPLPVAAAYLLAWGEFNIRRLKGSAAFEAFHAEATWRVRLLSSLGQSDAHYRRCLRFLRHVPFAELTRPRDFSASLQILDFLIGRRTHITV